MENNFIYRIRNPYSPLSIIADLSVIFGIMIIYAFRLSTPASIGSCVAVVIILEIISLIPGIIKMTHKKMPRAKA